MRVNVLGSQLVGILADRLLLHIQAAEVDHDQPNDTVRQGRPQHLLTIGQAGERHECDDRAGERAPDQSGFAGRLEHASHGVRRQTNRRNDRDKDGGDDRAAAGQCAEQTANHNAADLDRNDRFLLAVYAYALDDPLTKCFGNTGFGHNGTDASTKCNDQTDLADRAVQRAGKGLTKLDHTVTGQNASDNNTDHDRNELIDLFVESQNNVYDHRDKCDQ